MASVLFANGDAVLIINPQETEACLRFTPDPKGDGWDIHAINKLASDRNIAPHSDPKALEAFLHKAGKAKTSIPLEMIFAQGIPPEEPVAEKADWETLAIPDDMASIKDEILGIAEAPEVYRVRIERIKHEKKVKKAGALSFIPGKEEISIVWEKKEIKERVTVDEVPLEIKYAEKGAKLGTIIPSIPGKPGKSIFGRQIPPPPGGESGFLFGRGITRDKNLLLAAMSGFVRIGENWADIVPIAKPSWEITPGIDRVTLFFNFEPGDPRFTVPTGEDILAEAINKGAKKVNLLSAAEIDKAITEAMNTGEPIEAFSLFNIQEALARVDINADKTLAVLFLRKGVAGARPLEMKAISQAIKDSGVHGFNAEQLRADINAFMTGNDLVLSDYVLAEGASSVRGKDREVELSVSDLPEDEKEALKLRLKTWYSHHATLEANFKLDDPGFNLTFVQKEEVVARVSAESEGEAGKDIFGNEIPGLPGNDPDLRFFGGLELYGSLVRSMKEGLLLYEGSEKSFHGEVITCEDAHIDIRLSDDAMEARGNFSPEKGPGLPLTVENVKKAMSDLGIVKGIDREKLERACAYAREKGSVSGVLLAKGEHPAAPGTSAFKWLVQLDMPELEGEGDSGGGEYDDQADSEALTSKTSSIQIKAGLPIVEFSAKLASGKPGYDVRGTEIPAENGAALLIEHDESIQEMPYGKGTRLVAIRSGELRFDGKKLKIRSIKNINGDVGPSTGNIKFSGEIKISGNVLPGCAVIGGTHVTISGYAEEALVSAGGKVAVALGFKGGGRGVLRARAGITTAFVERTTVMAIGDIVLARGSILSTIKTNGKLHITAENGKLSGGICQARYGIDAADIGSEKALRTEISFGQDYIIKDEIAACEEEISKIKETLAKVEKQIGECLSSKLPLPDELKIEKIRLVKLLEQVNLKVFNLREKFEEHFESEIRIRGVIYPGVVMESHNRYYDVMQKRSRVVFYFDRESGRIKEKPFD